MGASPEIRILSEKVQDVPMRATNTCGVHTRRRAPQVLALVAAFVGLAACGSDANPAASGSSLPEPTSTTVADTSSTTAATTAATTATTTAASTSSSTPASACSGLSSIPTSARIDHQITGNVDGVGVDDTVTAYSASDGIPHVFLQRGGGAGGSDVSLPLGNADSVTISFEDIDHALGAATPPPLVILALGAGQAGSAFATILSADASPGHCLQQWTQAGSPFEFSIDQRGPYRGLLCDGAAGSIHYVLRTATPDNAGHVLVTSQEITHVGPAVTLNNLGSQTIADGPTVQHEYGDIQNCVTPPILP
jgi:hypothetical protein